MRIPGRTPLAACTLALAAVLLAGCSSSDPVTDPTKTPKPTPTPVFTSDAEALAAATATYKKYLRVADAVSQDGGANASRLTTVASGQAFDRASQTASDLAAQSWHTSGSTAAVATKLQSREQTKSLVRVSIYVCEDISRVDLLNSHDVSQVKAGRVNLVPYEVTVGGKDANSLIVTKREPWDSTGVCPS